LSHDALFKPEVVCNLRSDITKTASMSSTLHFSPTEEIKALENYKNDDGTTGSTYGGSNNSNSERYDQAYKNECEKKRQN